MFNPKFKLKSFNNKCFFNIVFQCQFFMKIGFLFQFGLSLQFLIFYVWIKKYEKMVFAAPWIVAYSKLSPTSFTYDSIISLRNYAD